MKAQKKWTYFDIVCDRIVKAQGQMFAKVGAGDTAMPGGMLLPGAHSRLEGRDLISGIRCTAGA